MEKNIALAILIVSLIFVGTLTFALGQTYITENLQEDNFIHSYTKAVCNENNYCEDYEIICEENKMLKLTPTGFAVQFSKDWKDQRNKEDIEKIC